MENCKDELRKRKYKDALPKDTIIKIRTILNELGIIPIEHNWNNTVEGYFSVRLMIQDTNLGVNGKGTTHEYALASAYAELMERLQNMTQYRLTIDVSSKAHQYKNFFYCPDEKGTSIYDLIYSDDDWIRQQKKKMPNEVDLQELLKTWKQMSYEEIPYDFISIPFMNLCTKRVSYIPMKMVSKMYMSNGMCAGNTAEEAIVQGISECLERYVNKKVIEEQITPPSYPEEHLKQYPRIYRMINNIEAKGNKKIIIKDCSLGKGLPVTAVIYIDKIMNAYFVKFGSHPIFEISVERTLTELLQGQDINRMMGLIPYTYDIENAVSHENIMNILVNGAGSYPPSFFEDQPSYQWQPFVEPEQIRNSDLLKHLVSFLENKGYHTYARDVSFLGFPSYHVLIPGISEVESIYSKRELDHYIQYVHVKRMIRNYSKLPEQEKKTLLDFLEKGKYFFSNISDLLFIKLKNNAPLQASSVGLFVAAAYCDFGYYQKAYSVFSKWFSFSSAQKENMDKVPYYRCILNYLRMKTEGFTEEMIKKTLKIFYPSFLVDKVCSQFDQGVSRAETFVKCFDCERCMLQPYCSYQKIEEVYLILKNSFYQSTISQKNLKDII
ncbi:MAG: YcaO-like family protein [Clostridia bacterium]|nr:YcaO-like family protein [Clostridia bacterium]